MGGDLAWEEAELLDICFDRLVTLFVFGGWDEKTERKKTVVSLYFLKNILKKIN